MKYGKTNKNGDAGEYFLAYKFTKELGWPCRLYGQDLGVDAEVEVLNDNSISNGDIIKVQIKAVDFISTKKKVSIYVDDRHIEYWKKFCLPVIVCCVDLSTENIYWKQVTSTEAYDTMGDSKKVTFCLQHDKFDSSSKAAFKKLVSPEKTKEIDKYFAKAKQLISNLPVQQAYYLDFSAINRDEDICNQLDDVIKEVDEILRSFPWKMSTYAQKELNWIKNMVRVTRVNISNSTTNLVNGG